VRPGQECDAELRTAPPLESYGRRGARKLAGALASAGAARIPAERRADMRRRVAAFLRVLPPEQRPPACPPDDRLDWLASEAGRSGAAEEQEGAGLPAPVVAWVATMPVETEAEEGQGGGGDSQPHGAKVVAAQRDYRRRPLRPGAAAAALRSRSRARALAGRLSCAGGATLWTRCSHSTSPTGVHPAPAARARLRWACEAAARVQVECRERAPRVTGAGRLAREHDAPRSEGQRVWAVESKKSLYRARSVHHFLARPPVVALTIAPSRIVD
jgi:hypothetical protein